MCDFRLNGADLRRRFGGGATLILAAAEDIVAEDSEWVLVKDGQIFWSPSAVGRSCDRSARSSIPISPSAPRGTARRFEKSPVAGSPAMPVTHNRGG